MIGELAAVPFEKPLVFEAEGDFKGAALKETLKGEALHIEEGVEVLLYILGEVVMRPLAEHI